MARAKAWLPMASAKKADRFRRSVAFILPFFQACCQGGG
jgi:hypothetical protein